MCLIGFVRRAREKQLSIVFREAMSHVASRARRVYRGEICETKVDGEKRTRISLCKYSHTLRLINVRIVKYGNAVRGSNICKSFQGLFVQAFPRYRNTSSASRRGMRTPCATIFLQIYTHRHCASGFGFVRSTNKKKQAPTSECLFLFAGDPYGNRTHVTAVKGPCLNRLTNGPRYGSGCRI